MTERNNPTYAPSRSPAENTQKTMLRLEALAKIWPALDDPSKELENQLKAITKKMPFQTLSVDLLTALDRAQDLLDGLGAYPTNQTSIYSSKLPGDPLAEPMPNHHNPKRTESKSQTIDIALPSFLSSIYPLGRIQSLTSYCDVLLTRAVADSHSSASQTRVLRTVMGSQYSAYYDSWQSELARAEERRQEEIRKQQEAIRIAVEQEREREERIRETEVREHPVEIP